MIGSKEALINSGCRGRVGRRLGGLEKERVRKDIC